MQPRAYELLKQICFPFYLFSGTTRTPSTDSNADISTGSGGQSPTRPPMATLRVDMPRNLTKDDIRNLDEDHLEDLMESRTESVSSRLSAFSGRGSLNIFENPIHNDNDQDF